MFSGLTQRCLKFKRCKMGKCFLCLFVVRIPSRHPRTSIFRTPPPRAYYDTLDFRNSPKRVCNFCRLNDKKLQTFSYMYLCNLLKWPVKVTDSLLRNAVNHHKGACENGGVSENVTTASRLRWSRNNLCAATDFRSPSMRTLQPHHPPRDWVITRDIVVVSE